MNGTTDAGEPSYTTGDTGNTQGGVPYDVGFSLAVLLFIMILIYTSYMCKRSTGSRSLTPPITSFPTTADSDTDDFHCMRLSSGLDDDILSSFPTFIYSGVEKPHKVNNKPEPHAVNYDSGCPICLADYESADVLRLLPECGHLFHVSCIDTWLKVRPTCPVCRNSPLPISKELT